MRADWNDQQSTKRQMASARNSKGPLRAFDICLINQGCLAGAEGFEPPTIGFGDRCSTIGTTPLKQRVALYEAATKGKADN